MRQCAAGRCGIVWRVSTPSASFAASFSALTHLRPIAPCRLARQCVSIQLRRVVQCVSVFPSGCTVSFSVSVPLRPVAPCCSVYQRVSIRLRRVVQRVGVPPAGCAVSFSALVPLRPVALYRSVRQSLPGGCGIIWRVGAPPAGCAVSFSASVRLQPVAAHAPVGLQADIQFRGALHLLGDDRDHALPLFGQQVDHHFVVHLHDHG